MRFLLIQIPAIIALFFLNNSIVKAKYYQTFYSNRIVYFADEYKDIQAIRFDTVRYDKDSVFISFNNIQEKYDYCITPYGASWIGKKVIIKDNGINCILNRKGDTIKINTLAGLGDEWIAYLDTDSLIIKANVENLGVKNFMGISDTSKTIGFQAYNKDLSKIDHNVNSLKIILSKSYGLIQTLNFYLFPDFYNGALFSYLTTYNLVGISNPEMGVQNVKWLDVYDFAVGDEIHTKHYTRSTYPEYTSTTKTIYKYIERQDYPDSVFYLADITQSTEINNNGNYSYKYKQDTLQLKYIADSSFDKLPGEPVIVDIEVYTNHMIVAERPVKVVTGYDRFYGGEDGCWYMLLVDGCFADDRYIKGLGGPYYSCDNDFMMFYREDLTLEYYKKGTEVKGTPLIISDIDSYAHNVKAEIFPNPAEDIVMIKTENNNGSVSLKFTDVNGRVVLLKTLDSFPYYLNIENLENGIYFYQISMQNEIIKYGKLIHH